MEDTVTKTDEEEEAVALSAEGNRAVEESVFNPVLSDTEETAPVEDESWAPERKATR